MGNFDTRMNLFIFIYFSLFHPSLFIQYSKEECSTVQLFIYKIIAVMIDIDTSRECIAVYGPVQYSTVQYSTVQYSYLQVQVWVWVWVWVWVCVCVCVCLCECVFVCVFVSMCVTRPCGVGVKL